MHDVSLANDMLKELSYSHKINYKNYSSNNKNYYLTSDKKCICKGECTSWCYVNDSCPNHKRGWTGKYKNCNSSIKYTDDEAHQMIRQTAHQQEVLVKRQQERRKQLELKTARRLLDRENSIIEIRQAKILAKQELPETKQIIQTFQQNLKDRNISAEIIMLLQKNRAYTFTGRYKFRNIFVRVIIKFLAPEGISGNEAKIQQLAADYDIAPGIYQNYQNKIIIMEYLSIEDGWITHNEIHKFESITKKYILREQYENICDKINKLSSLNIDHGSLKGDNIMFNYKNGDVRILDYESSRITQKKQINSTGTYTHHCAITSSHVLPVDYRDMSDPYQHKL
jgi:predicted Ser/Thr protein kinase